MKFRYHSLPDLPKLAWCAIVLYNSMDIHVYHGYGIETFENLFRRGLGWRF